MKPRTDLLQDVFEFMNSIMVTKENLIQTDEDEARYRKCRFLLLRGLSFSPNQVEAVNLVNTLTMPPRQEYAVLLSTIGIDKRRPKWIKKSAPSLYLASVQKYYEYNQTKALQAMKLLSVEQLAMIDKKLKKEDDAWEISSEDSG